MKTAVLGGGIMGSGIAQLCAAAGHEVTLLDVDEERLQAATAAVQDSLARLLRRERITTAERDATLGRISTTVSLDEAVTAAGLVVEAVPEELALKQRLFAEVAARAPQDCILATNTSQLSITAVGAELGEASERLVGMHFFNPPVLMRLVELIAGLRTRPDVLEAAATFAEGLGKEVVVCRKDTPGFITTRLSAILRLECMRMLDEGIASATDIDRAVKLAFNHPMGPLELGDFNGHDTFLKASLALEEAHGDRFKPPPVLRNLVAAGRLGRKTAAGVYDYDADGQRLNDSGLT